MTSKMTSAWLDVQGSGIPQGWSWVSGKNRGISGTSPQLPKKTPRYEILRGNKKLTNEVGVKQGLFRVSILKLCFFDLFFWRGQKLQ